MGLKRRWFGFLKRFFACNADSSEKKGTRRQRWCFGRLKKNQHYRTLETPTSKGIDYTADQKQHTLALTVAMTAAAEAAVAAANAAAELARLVRSSEELQRMTRTVAAIKIQSFYRAHLAWKALIGLRGVVKLQSLIRGQIVRQKVFNQSKSTQPLEITRSKVHQIWVPTSNEVSRICNEKHEVFSPQNERKNDQILNNSTAIRNHHRERDSHKKLRCKHKQHQEEQYSPSFRSRTSYNPKRHYYLSPDQSDTSLPNSPIFPTYMATTESFMAKARSLSTPRQRISFLEGCCNHSLAFGMPMLSSSSSVNGSMKGNYRLMHM